MAAASLWRSAHPRPRSSGCGIDDRVRRTAQSVAQAPMMLDTHVALALYEGHSAGLRARVRRALESGTVSLSPMVLLELELLNEIGRIRPRAQDVAVSLSEQLAIRIAADSFPAVVKEALPLAYTRDPFDRLIVAHAALRKQPPVTFDRVLLEHCKLAMH